jgi:hypothetical protein
MNTKDFSQLFPEILNPAASLSNLKALCRSKKYPEDEFASCLHEFCLVRNKYPGYIENPGGYLYSTILNSINKYFRGVKNDFSDIDNLSDTVEMDDHDKKSLKEKLDDFIRGIHKLNLPTNQRRLIEEMVVICENDHNTHRGFIKEVREAQARHGVTNANFRKLLERLKNNLKGNDGLKDMLSFIPKDDQNINELIELLLSYIPMATTKLDAYRFSSEEMKKMLWLKDLFEDNGFTVERFPEVYYDTFENLKEDLELNLEKIENSEIKIWHEEILDDSKWNNLFEGFKYMYENHRFELTPSQLEELKSELTPDMLGVYKISENTLEPKCDCGIKIIEGKIILFKDRIEKVAAFISYAESQNLNTIIDTLRFKVLMHELGHWFTHWPRSYDFDKKLNVNWECGYYRNSFTSKPDKITHESLAQLICFWTTNDSHLSRKILIEYCTPSDKDNEYNKYLPLINSSKQEILKKLKIIRDLCKFTDDEKYNFLKSNFTDIHSYVANEVYLEIKNNNGDYGLNVHMEDIARISFVLLEFVYSELIEEKKNSSSPFDFQIVYKKLNKIENENKEISELWEENKKFFGEAANDDLLKGANMMKRFGSFKNTENE